jgi:hypothetical protein
MKSQIGEEKILMESHSCASITFNTGIIYLILEWELEHTVSLIITGQ